MKREIECVCVHSCHRVSLLESVLQVTRAKRRGTFFLEKKEGRGEKKAKGTRQLVPTLFLDQI